MFINKWKVGRFVNIKELNRVDRELSDFLYSNKIKASVSRENIMKFIKDEYGAYNVKLGGRAGQRRGFYFGESKGWTPQVLIDFNEILSNTENFYPDLTNEQIKFIAEKVLEFRKNN